MATTIITVSTVVEKSRGDSTWLELTGEKNVKYRIFKKIQDVEGKWHDLSSKYEMLRNSENRTLKLTIEQKGRFTNVLDAELEENPPAIEPATLVVSDNDCRLRTFTTAYAKDLAVAGKIQVNDILTWAEVFFRYLKGELPIAKEKIVNLSQFVKG